MDKIITGALKEKKLDDLLDSLSDLRSQTDNNKNIHKKIDQSIARIIDEYVIPNPPEEKEYDTLKDIYLKHMSDDDVSSPIMDIIAKKTSNNADQILANTDPKCVILIFDIIRDIVKGDEKYKTRLKPFIDKATLCENKDEREILTGVFNYNHSIELRKK